MSNSTANSAFSGVVNNRKSSNKISSGYEQYKDNIVELNRDILFSGTGNQDVSSLALKRYITLGLPIVFDSNSDATTAIRIDGETGSTAAQNLIDALGLANDDALMLEFARTNTAAPSTDSVTFDGTMILANDETYALVRVVADTSTPDLTITKVKALA